MLCSMNVLGILKEIDDEIDVLQRVKSLLGTTSVAATASLAKEAARRAAKPVTAAKPERKRTMSEEGRARIAAAQKKRWALKAEASAAASKASPTGKTIAKKIAPDKGAKAKAKNPRKTLAVKSSTAADQEASAG